MKQRIILLAFIMLGLNASAQTLNVKKDNVVYQFPASQAADMWYTDGKTLTIMDKAFTLSELTKMYVDFSTVTDNQVDVAYNGGSATVYIAGNIAQYVDATEASGHVVVNQLSNVGDDTCGEITYHLSGSCSDGQFYMTGSYKASVELDGLTLTSSDTAPICCRLVIGKVRQLRFHPSPESCSMIDPGRMPNMIDGACIISGWKIRSPYIIRKCAPEKISAKISMNGRLLSEP